MRSSTAQPTRPSLPLVIAAAESSRISHSKVGGGELSSEVETPTRQTLKIGRRASVLSTSGAIRLPACFGGHADALMRTRDAHPTQRTGSHDRAPVRAFAFLMHDEYTQKTDG
jgi:hypothetical protein